MSSLAIVLVIGAAVSHAGWNILAHGVSRIGAPFLFWSAIAATVLWAGAIPFTGGLGTDDVGAFLLGVGVSAVIHVAYMVVLQQGYARGRLSTVYATARGTGPFVSVILAVILLGERPTALALVGVLVVISGVVAVGLVDRHRGSAQPLARRGLDPSIMLGLVTGVTIAAYTIWDAAAVRDGGLSPVAFMVGCTLLEVPLYAAALGRRRKELVGVLRDHLWRIVAFGVLSPLSYILVLTAVTIAPVALVAPMREMSVVIVSVVGALALKEGRPGPRIAAALVVVAGIVLIAI